MDLWDILDFIVDPFFDLILCRFNLKIWMQKTIVSLLLLSFSVTFLFLLVGGIHAQNLMRSIIGGVGLLFFGFLDFRYTWWWMKEGRFGIDPPWLDSVPIPPDDITSTLSEETTLRSRTDDIKERISNRL